MPDINLLPEDLRKKINNSSKDRGTFNLEDIEFTEGEKLKKDKKPKVDLATKNKFKKWFHPQTENQFKSQKTKIPRLKDNYNTLNRDDFLEEQDIKSDKPLPLQEKEEVQSDKKVQNQKGALDNNLKDERKKRKAFNFFAKSRINQQEKQKLEEIKKDWKKLEKEPKIIKKRKKGSLIQKIIEKFKKGKGDKASKEKNLNVNLLPFGTNVPTIRKTFSLLMIVFILSISLLFAVYFAFYMQKEKLVKDYNSLEEELVFYINDIKKYDKLMDEVSSWQDKVKKIDTLLGEHIYWTKFFEKLEENILPEVKFTGFAGTIGSSLSLEAAAPDYKTVAKQWIILEDADDFAESVDIGGISMRSGQDNIYVSFSLLLNLVEDNFYRK